MQHFLFVNRTIRSQLAVIVVVVVVRVRCQSIRFEWLIMRIRLNGFFSQCGKRFIPITCSNNKTVDKVRFFVRILLIRFIHFSTGLLVSRYGFESLAVCVSLSPHKNWNEPQPKIICPWILLITEFHGQFTKHATDEYSDFGFLNDFLSAHIQAAKWYWIFCTHQPNDYDTDVYDCVCVSIHLKRNRLAVCYFEYRHTLMTF